jgi:hypothetical protein
MMLVNLTKLKEKEGQGNQEQRGPQKERKRKKTEQERREKKTQRAKSTIFQELCQELCHECHVSFLFIKNRGGKSAFFIYLTQTQLSYVPHLFILELGIEFCS